MKAVVGKNIYFLLLAVVMPFLFSSCAKEKDTRVSIKVESSSGIPLKGAKVKVIPKAWETNGGTIDPSLFKSDVTDENGVVDFDYTEEFKWGQTGYAVFHLEVTYSSDQVDEILDVKMQTNNSKKVVFDNIP